MNKNIDVKNLKVAKRYVSALIDVVDTQLEDAQNSMSAILEVIFQNKEFELFFSHPIISLKDKKDLFAQTFEEKINKNVFNFFMTLLDENRLDAFKNIYELFREEADKLKNIQNIEILSAVNIEDEEKERLIKQLSSKLSKEIVLNVNENKDILGGLVIKYQDKVIDLSLKNKLEAFRNIN